MAGFLTTNGRELVDEEGRAVRLRGAGIGNWLLPEGYMWRLPAPVDRPRRIEQLVRDLIGDDEARAFWAAFRDRFITEHDVAGLARDGFNSLRLPLNARLVSDPESGVLVEHEMARVDRLIAWCREHGIYVILDLHGAPGGQTGTNIDDSEHDRPDLFVDESCAEATIRLWRELAARYANEWIVAGYDLLNEPLPNWFARYNDRVLPLYRRMTEAIRSVDARHTIILEGVHWATDWSIFTERIDDNLVLEFHKYWSNPDRESLAPYLEMREAWNVPIFMGEGGENNCDWYAGAFRLYDDLDISWNFWTWKKMDTTNSPLSIRPPAGWERVIEAARAQSEAARLAVLSRADATDIFREYAENVSSERCDPHPEVTNALLRRPPVRVPAIFYANEERGTGFSCPMTNRPQTFRATDRVPMVYAGRSGLPSLADDAPSFEHGGGEPWQPDQWIAVRLDAGAWFAYDIEAPLTARYGLTVAFHVDQPAVLAVLTERRPAASAVGASAATEHTTPTTSVRVAPGDDFWSTHLWLEKGACRFVVRVDEGVVHLTSITVGAGGAEV